MTSHFLAISVLHIRRAQELKKNWEWEQHMRMTPWLNYEGYFITAESVYAHPMHNKSLCSYMRVSLWWMSWDFTRSSTPFFRWQLRAEVILRHCYTATAVNYKQPRWSTLSNNTVLSVAYLENHSSILPIQINPSCSFLFSTASMQPVALLLLKMKPQSWIGLEQEGRISREA